MFMNRVEEGRGRGDTVAPRRPNERTAARGGFAAVAVWAEKVRTRTEPVDVKE